MSLPRHVHKKTAKGKTYYYFDLGKDAGGRRQLKRLPGLRDKDFGKALQTAQALRTKGEGRGSAKDFDWLIRIFEKSPEFAKLAASSKEVYLRHLGYAAQNFRSQTGRSWPVEIITAGHIVALRDKYAPTPGTANSIVRSLGALFAWATKPGRHYIKENIARGIERLDTGEYEPWPEALVEEALDDPVIRLPVALLYFLGQRIGDTARLGRGHLSNGVVSLTQQKTCKSLRITVHERLARIIELDAPRDALLFILNEHGKPITETGLRWRIQEWAKARGHHVVPHGLRKNAVNALLEAGCSTAEVSAITGQSLQTIEHYAKLRDSEHLGRSAILKFEARNKAGTRKPELKTG